MFIGIYVKLILWLFMGRLKIKPYKRVLSDVFYHKFENIKNFENVETKFEALEFDLPVILKMKK